MYGVIQTWKRRHYTTFCHLWYTSRYLFVESRTISKQRCEKNAERQSANSRLKHFSKTPSWNENCCSEIAELILALHLHPPSQTAYENDTWWNQSRVSKLWYTGLSYSTFQMYIYDWGWFFLPETFLKSYQVQTNFLPLCKKNQCNFFNGG